MCSCVRVCVYVSLKTRNRNIVPSSWKSLPNDFYQLEARDKLRRKYNNDTLDLSTASELCDVCVSERAWGYANLFKWNET